MDARGLQLLREDIEAENPGLVIPVALWWVGSQKRIEERYGQGVIRGATRAANRRAGPSVAHESRTPYYGLGFFELLLDLGRAGFTSLTRVKARVDTIVFESMKNTI
jgi:hypothetical protein